MRRSFPRWVAILLFASVALVLVAARPPDRPPRRWAVLIAADGTAEAPVDAALTQTVRRIGGVLSGGYGYSPESIAEIYDSEALHKRIYVAVNDLREGVRPGDTVFVFLALPEATAVGGASGLVWLPWDGSPDRAWSFIQPVELADALGQLDGANVLVVTPSCLALARQGFADVLQYKVQSFRIDSRTVHYELSGCSRERRPAELAGALLEALESGLGEGRLEFSGEDLALYLKKSATGMRIEYLRQSSNTGALPFIRERLELDPELLRLLGATGGDAKPRLTAIQDLVNFVFQQPPANREALTEALTERLLAIGETPAEDATVRGHAIGAVGQLRSTGAIPRLASLARTDPGSAGTDAVRAIEAIGGETAIELLEGLVTSLRPQIRAASMRALARARSSGSLDLVVAQLAIEADPEASLAGLEAIQVLSPDASQAVVPVAALLARQPADARVRREAIGALGNLGHPAALPILLEQLELADVELATAAAYAIAKVGTTGSDEASGMPGDQGAVEAALVRALRRDPAITVAAAQALGRHGSAAAVEPLMAAGRALEPGSPSGGAIATALGALRDWRATRLLLSMLEDPNRTNRRAASQALGALGDPSAIEDLERVRAGDEDPYVREAAAAAINEIRTQRVAAPPRGAAHRLVLALAGPDLELRSRASQELDSLPESVVVPAVAKALEHDDPSVRSAAARQLGKLGHSQEALSLLLHHRSDSSMWVRGGVYSSLGAFRDPGALAALQEAERVEKDAQPRRDLAAALLEQSRYLLEAGRLEESREAAQSSLAIREETYWVDHPLVGESLAALARIDIEEGAYDAAEGNLRRAIATAGGAENPTTTDWWRDYGRALELRGDSQQALSIYLRVVENRERLQGPRGPAIVEALKDVARVLEATGDPEGAGKFRRRAVELQSATARY